MHVCMQTNEVDRTIDRTQRQHAHSNWPILTKNINKNETLPNKNI